MQVYLVLQNFTGEYGGNPIAIYSSRKVAEEVSKSLLIIGNEYYTVKEFTLEDKNGYYKEKRCKKNKEEKTSETRKDKKKYFFSVVEEAIMNPDYFGFRAGRIEVFDRDDPSGYDIGEARFMIPEEFFEEFRETWDFKHSNKMPYINWDMRVKEK